LNLNALDVIFRFILTSLQFSSSVDLLVTSLLSCRWWTWKAELYRRPFL